MKKLSQQDFDALPIVGRYRQCPTGDYSDVAKFGSFCAFDLDCKFDLGCKFDSFCAFDLGCKFDSFCKFGAGCKFDSLCEFGADCKFGSGCEFGADCKFGSGCVFGADCKFDLDCKFGSGCMFGAGCSVEDGNKIKDPGNAILQLSYAGSVQRLTTAFNTVNGPIIRCGCFLGTLDAFRAAVRETHRDSKHARVYLGWADLVEIQFGGDSMTDTPEISRIRENQGGRA